VPITNDNASEPGNEPPDLRKQAARGQESQPAIWFKRVAGVAWDGNSKKYKKEKDRWRGWIGRNERRVQQRQNSYQQTQDANEHMKQKRRREQEQEEEEERLRRQEREQRQRESWAQRRSATTVIVSITVTAPTIVTQPQATVTVTVNLTLTLPRL
jgi:hypothetical protein